MSIPDYESIMLPLLEHLADGRERATQETLDTLGRVFNLTELELRQLLPSGRQELFRNRVAWAKFYLKKAGLIESPRRGVYHIAGRGKEALAARPNSIEVGYLMQFPEFRGFLARSRGAPTAAPNLEPASDSSHTSARPTADALERTPEELLEVAYSRIQEHLASELLQRILESPPEFFENLVVDLLVKLGYGGSREDAGQTVGRTGDGGVDGVINEDPLGLDRIYLQAKRWEGTVGRPEVQKFAGALQGLRATKGVFITTSSFSGEAEDFARSLVNKIVLIDGAYLTRLMIAHDIGVTETTQYRIKRVDSDYFSSE